jgi:hypothetical protein
VNLREVECGSQDLYRMVVTKIEKKRACNSIRM